MTKRSDWQLELLSAIPAECPITLEHAHEHLTSAREAEEEGDKDQMLHDADMAGRILFALFFKGDDNG